MSVSVGGSSVGGSRGWNLLFSETEKLRISVSKIRLKSVIFYSGPPF